MERIVRVLAWPPFVILWIILVVGPWISIVEDIRAGVATHASPLSVVFEAFDHHTMRVVVSAFVVYVTMGHLWPGRRAR